MLSHINRSVSYNGAVKHLQIVVRKKRHSSYNIESVLVLAICILKLQFRVLRLQVNRCYRSSTHEKKIATKLFFSPLPMYLISQQQQ